MMAERQNLSQLYPGIAPDKPNHRTSIPLSCATFELQFGKLLASYLGPADQPSGDEITPFNVLIV